jgi:putative glutathione S-transferase
MGLLINGTWHDQWYDTTSSKGNFQREAAKIRHWITKDGSSGPTGDSGFKAESNRYHLYVSLACPWAHRTLIFRVLKQLQEHITISVVSPDMLEQGWTFDTGTGSTGDSLNGFDYLHQVYTAHQADYSGRVTVPVLWDSHNHCIVNNESADIIRMFSRAFNKLTGNDNDYYPLALSKAIDTINSTVYNNVNNGVYRCGFATTQTAYEGAFHQLFNTLDQLEQRLDQQGYLVGEHITEADWRLFTTLVRFDAVYHGHFKCNKKRIEDYPNLINYVRALYQWPGIADTVNFDHIKRHYYFSHTMINPTQVVPLGPAIDYGQPHNRDAAAYFN